MQVHSQPFGQLACLSKLQRYLEAKLLPPYFLAAFVVPHTSSESRLHLASTPASCHTRAEPYYLTPCTQVVPRSHPNVYSQLARRTSHDWCPSKTSHASYVAATYSRPIARERYMLTPRRLTCLWDIYSLRTNRSRAGVFGDAREEATEKKKEKRGEKGREL